MGFKYAGASHYTRDAAAIEADRASAQPLSSSPAGEGHGEGRSEGQGDVPLGSRRIEVDLDGTRCGGMGSSAAPRPSPGSLLSVLPDAERASMPEWKLRQLDRLLVNVPVQGAAAANHTAAA